jgi:hypothetical protein
MDIRCGEMVEKELDAMIERRSRKGDVDPDEREALWKKSVRRYDDRRREENRGGWLSWYRCLESGYLQRVAECGRRAEALEMDTATEPGGGLT